MYEINESDIPRHQKEANADAGSKASPASSKVVAAAVPASADKDKSLLERAGNQVVNAFKSTPSRMAQGAEEGVRHLGSVARQVALGSNKMLGINDYRSEKMQESLFGNTAGVTEGLHDVTTTLKNSADQYMTGNAHYDTAKAGVSRAWKATTGFFTPETSGAGSVANKEASKTGGDKVSEKAGEPGSQSRSLTESLTSAVRTAVSHTPQGMLAAQLREQMSAERNSEDNGQQDANAAQVMRQR